MQTYRSFTKVVLSALLMLLLSGAVITPAQAQTVASALSSEESSGLQFMIEEEKLARDVYQTLDTQWNLRIFQNISRAEQQHMDAVAILLDQYELANPTASNDIGVFADPDLQALYNQLVEDGSQSLTAALLVGTAIEEIDILDLEVYIGQTDNADLLRVYANLMRGSENHLRAFVSNWERRTGESYAPQYLSQADYGDLMTTIPSRGGRGNRGGNGR